MPRTRYTLIPDRLLVALLAALCIFLYVPANARRIGQSSGAQRSTSNTNSQSAPRTARKRITPLSSSETSEGSRLTITSDAPLNDYAASRSGDHFYVVIPQAEASAVQRGLRGRGFTDAQVQRRGNDVVLSVRLQPGASARVSQRFNRLDVIFTAPGAAANTNTAANTQVANTNTTPAHTPSSNTRVETNTATQKPKEAQPTPTPARESAANNTETRPAETPRRTETPNATPSEVAASTNTSALPQTNPSPVGNPSPAQSATPAASPEQIAQARPTPATPTAITMTPSTSSTVTIGAVIARNWPFVLMAVLLLAGIGLFVGTRASARQAPAAASPPAATTGAPGGSVASASPTQAQPAQPVAPPLPAAAPPAAPVEAKKPAVEKKVKPKKAVPKAPPLEEARSVTELEPAVPVSTERAGIEISRLLDGENYDRAVVGTSHGPSRQLIAAELLAALAARNLERRERARAAFVEHNYFDDATHTLRSAEAPAERASAARSLGLVGDRAATPHLVDALEDSSAEVRRASVEALAEIHDPAAVEPLERLREREKDQKRKVSPALIQRAIEASSAPKVIETPPPVPEVTEATLPAPTAESPAPAMPPPDITAAETFAPSPAGVEEPVTEAPPAEQIAPEPVSIAEEAAAPEIIAIPEEETMLPPVAATEAPPSAPAEETVAAVPETAPATAESAAEAPPPPSAAPPPVAEAAPGESTHEIAQLYESLIEPETGFETPVTPPPAEEPPAPVAAPEPEKEYPVTVADEWVELDMNEPEPHRAPPVAAAAPPTPVVEEEAPKAIEPIQWPEPVEHPAEESVEITPLEEGPAEVSMAEATRAIVEREAPTVGGVGAGETAEAAAMRRPAGEDPQTKAAHVAELSHRDGEEAFNAICAAFDDPSEEVRNAAARALYTIRSDRADSFTRALREATPERRRHIGAAISSSGLASEAISRLTGESRDKTYDAFSLLFLMAKAGELQPLIRAIETHPETDVRLAVVKLLALSGQHEILPAFRRLAVRGSLPTEVRAAVMEAIYQIGSQSTPDASMKR